MIWDWMDRAEHWLWVPSISPVLMLLILLGWTGLILSLRLIKQDAPKTHRRLYYFALAGHVAFVVILFWGVIVQISVA